MKNWVNLEIKHSTSDLKKVVGGYIFVKEKSLKIELWVKRDLTVNALCLLEQKKGKYQKKYDQMAKHKFRVLRMCTFVDLFKFPL